MLFFAARPDKVFEGIILTGMEIIRDVLKDLNYADQDALSSFSDRIRRMFSRDALLVEVSSLLSAHSSNKLFGISNYHFLVLYEIIENEVDLHNDYLADGSGGRYKNLSMGNIDFDAIVDAYFHDVDFLTPPAVFEKLISEQKAMMGFSEETFGVVQGLKPHPDELVLEEIDAPDDWDRFNLVYKPNENYPYVPPESREQPKLL